MLTVPSDPCTCQIIIVLSLAALAYCGVLNKFRAGECGYWRRLVGRVSLRFAIGHTPELLPGPLSTPAITASYVMSIAYIFVMRTATWPFDCYPAVGDDVDDDRDCYPALWRDHYGHDGPCKYPAAGKTKKDTMVPWYGIRTPPFSSTSLPQLPPPNSARNFNLYLSWSSWS